MTTQQRIFKYELEVLKPYGVRDILPYITLPYEAAPTHVGYDPRGVLCVWCLVNPDNPKCQHDIAVYATGEPIEPGKTFLGTVITPVDPDPDIPGYVWHVFIGPGVPVEPIKLRPRSKEMGS